MRDNAMTGRVITIGNFDGLHLGHQRLIQTARENAESLNAEAVAFSFFPHPVTVLRDSAFQTLLTSEEKKCLLKAMGIDSFIEYPFDNRLAELGAEQFISEILCAEMRCKAIVVGEGYRFGHKGGGDSGLLLRLGDSLGFKAVVVPHLMMRGKKISSTYVREAVNENRLADAEELMGRPYLVMGEVVRGNRLGHTINVPTANIIPPKYKLLPPAGVYRAAVRHRGKAYRSLTNVGTRPTVDAGSDKVVETHLLGFDGDLYGQTLTIEFHGWIRPEVKFAGLDELKTQIQRDIAQVEKF